MKNTKLKLMTFTGIFTALIFIATRFFAFPGPVPPGYINLGDSLIIVCAVYAGSKGGAFAGAFGSALADIAYGAWIFVPITFIVKGLEGFIVGKIAKKESTKSIVIAAVSGVIVMIGGYFLFEFTILPLIDSTFGLSVALLELPFNGIQGAVNATIGIILSLLLKRTKGIERLQ